MRNHADGTGFDYDLVILGSGFAGSLTAVVACAIGLRVLLVEKTDHPHFAIGESITAEVLRRLDYLAQRYQAPEISNLSSYTRIKRSGLPIATWPKAHINFVRHEVGKPVDPAHPEEVIVQASTWPLGPDAHAYRPEFDRVVKDMAVNRGTVYLPHTSALAFRFDPETGVALAIQSDGAAPADVRCRLVVDATGSSCWLSKHLGHWRYDSADVPMASAAIFAHFRNVKLWETVLGARPIVFPRDHGTLLHVGSHGMLWMIPFDNGLTSLGWVTGQGFPAEGNAETLFWDMVRHRPSLAALLADATATTPYYRIDRVQYSTAQVAGDGFFLLPASAEFSDPLYSVGLPLTTAAISRLMLCLERADRTRPVTARDLEGLEERFRQESKYIRLFTKTTKRAFLNYELLNRIVNVNRLLVFREGAYIGTATPPDAAAAAAWGTDDPMIQSLIQELHDFVMSVDVEQPVSPASLDTFDRIVARRDQDGFAGSAFGRLRANGVYLNSIPRLVNYFLTSRQHPLGLSRAGGFWQITRRWVRSFGVERRAIAPARKPTVSGLIRAQLRALVQP